MGALVFNSLLFEKIWGSNYFKNEMKNTDNDKIGEMWTLSAINNSETICINGNYANKTLSELYQDKSLFGNTKATTFPVLIKLIATSDDLSVQVHPNDGYAKKYENSYGKTEGWLIANRDDSSRIVIGHHAKNKEEFISAIKNKKVPDLLNSIPVNKGEFYPIPSGTIHAIGKNLLIIEIQQSSDITYRLYDYDRVDKNNKKRELHIEKALDVINFDKYSEDIKNINTLKTNLVWDNKYFSVEMQEINGEYQIQTGDKYCMCCLIDGNINVEGIDLYLCQSFIVPVHEKTIVTGNGKLFIVKSKI